MNSFTGFGWFHYLNALRGSVGIFIVLLENPSSQHVAAFGAPSVSGVL